MSLQPGQAFGNYTIVAKLGEGGMGEVYRATDTRLGRDVAIKILPAAVAADPDRRSRFDREAKALAALSHSNIAQVYGIEENAIVMELLEGETLRDRLGSGALSVRKAVDFGAQIARGLAAAHDRGIIHRDLKPENVFILNDGQIKILDFGLAKQAAAEAHAATMTSDGTSPGVVLGTSGYMSPEQVRGAAVDSRADVFALGVVLFEMFTGQRAFKRDSIAETMSAILNEHPSDISRVRMDVDAAIDRIVQHCLEKQPAERFQSVRDVAFALEALSGSSSSMARAAVPAARRNWERWGWAALSLGLAAAALWPSRTASTAIPGDRPALTRTVLPLPEDVSLNEASFPGTRLALSPDATQLVFSGRDRRTGRAQLYLQSLAGGQLKVLPGTINGTAPSWSPDSKQIAFADTTRMWRLAIDGASPVALSELQGAVQPVAWGPDGTLLIGGGTVRQLSLQGAPPVEVRRAENQSYGYPKFLPDGRHYLLGVTNRERRVSLRVASLDTKDDRELLNGDIDGFAYAAGALLFSRNGELFAQRLDPTRLELAGESVSLAAQVDAYPLRGASYSVSGNVLVYQTAARLDTSQLTWFDRRGTVLATVGEPSDFSNVELSNDGRRVLVSATDPVLLTRDIFIVDVVRGVRQRFTLDPSDERSAVWSPDQRRVFYNSKALNLYSRAADLSGEEQGVVVDGGSKDPYDVSPDGRLLLFRRSGTGTGNDLWVQPIGGGEARPIATTRFNESGANFSADGRWIAYVSDESGQPEVYATRVEGGGKIQVSANGGSFPRWRGDGKEIFYVAQDRTLMTAKVERMEPALEVAAPVPLFRLNAQLMQGPIYDVSADGSRFIVAAHSASRVAPSITVLQNWPLLLPAR